MELIRSVADLDVLDRWRQEKPLVLVPTMGALHPGHLSLVEIGARYGPVVVTIFVNPTQFGPGEDFTSYPADLEQDLDLLAPLPVAAVFVPGGEQMYGQTPGVMVQPGARAIPLCGARRSGHFAGVLTVVAKLFNLTRPDLAVFGRKDAQQCLVIAEMVRDLDFGVRLVDAPTVRDADGLALSSRNQYLSPGDRQRALALPRALATGRRLLAAGERDAGAVEATVRAELAPTDAIDYAELRSVPELKPLATVRGRVVLAVAATVGPARLIDNLVLEVDDDRVVECPLLDPEANDE